MAAANAVRAAGTGSAIPPARASPTSAVHRAAPSTVRRAESRVTELTRHLGRRGFSIAAVDLHDGVTFDYGARHGMLCASVAKLFILETLLLQHQDSGRPLGARRTALAAEMIENSDNDAADDLYVDVGEAAGLRRAAAVLGVHGTTPGAGIYWGYTRTGARSYLALLADLVGGTALDAHSRHFALTLMSHVESDQQWGVGSVADAGTRFYLKNGWLAVATDSGRWAVNSVGVVTVRGRRLLIVVMTQHDDGFDDGVDLVDRLARIAARVVDAG